MSYDYILKTDNPDKEIEFFWCNFKDNVYEFLSEEDKYEITNLSQKLNLLQKDKKYEQIEIYIHKHIEKIGFKIIENNDYYKANHLDTNIKRWKKISLNDIYCKKNVFFCIFKIFLFINNKTSRALEKNYQYILQIIKKYAIQRDEKYLIELMNFAIKKELLAIIDKLRTIISLKDFLNDKLLNFDDKMKAKKLIKFLKPVETLQNGNGIEEKV